MISSAYIQGPSSLLETVSGYVTEVERYAIHDGYGVRTVVFLKGCPMRCRWCSNPETQLFCPEPAFFESECIACGRCVAACPNSALHVQSNTLYPDKSICLEKCVGHQDVFPCTNACPAGGRQVYGVKRTVKSLYDEVSRDLSFYNRDTGGGLTISGGEPLAQPELTYALLRNCSEHWIDTAIETCGLGAPEDYVQIAPYLNFVFADLKSMDPEKHREWTGTDNAPVLDNIRVLGRLAEQNGFELVIRTPVIPGFNDLIEDIEAIAEFISGCTGIAGYELLPYHRLGRSKYWSLSREYPLADVTPPTEEHMRILRELLTSYSIKNLNF